MQATTLKNIDPFVENKKYFDRPISEYVYFDKYSRFNRELGRRETWPESVSRVVDFLRELSENKLSDKEYQRIHDLILNMQISPSMRLMATAGKAARRNHIALYNCCYMPISSMGAIAELLWVSMSGVGAGYSVEKRYINLIPKVQEQISDDKSVFVIADTTEGWVQALKTGLDHWMNGLDIEFDYSNIRPAGEVLKTKGGRSSGPSVLKDFLDFTRDVILSRQGKNLRPIDVFDICTRLGWAAVSGGSRRSAQLVIFDLDDEEMLSAKQGKFWEKYPHRVNANISAVWENRLSFEQVSKYMNNMFDSGVGEPGITSRRAANLTRPEWRRELTHGGQNACSEVNLQGSTADGRIGGQFCNLSTVQVYPNDDFESLKEKVHWATVIGTIQSMATDFKLLRPEWKEICEEERLLGVSIIGTMDNETSRDPNVQKKLKHIAENANIKYARELGINRSASIATLKPAGNSSVLYNVARGINARYSPYYIRRVRVNAHTPMYKVLRDSGVSMRPENGQNGDGINTYVATFYEKSPDGSITIDDLSAIDQCEYWKQVKLNWCHHNPSVTIEYKEEEKEDLIQWVYENQDIINGMSFLPRTDHIYEQAPYEPITEEEYYKSISSFPEIDFALLQEYEQSDMTEREIECSAGVCDLF